MAEWSKEIRETLHLGVPMAGAQLSQILMNTTDVALVGRLSGDALAAMAVGQAMGWKRKAPTPTPTPPE